MKKTLIPLIAGLFFTIAGIAQPPGGQFDPEEMVKRQTQQMVEDLGLNEAQEVKVDSLNRKYSQKMGEMFQSAQGDFQGMREKMETLREEKNAELKTILTEEQYTKHVELEKKRMEEFRSRRRDGGGGPQGTPPGRRGAPRGNRR